MQFPNYVFAETLRDGTAVTVRAAGANDGPKIRRAFLDLERDTVYTRFCPVSGRWRQGRSRSGRGPRPTHEAEQS